MADEVGDDHDQRLKVLLKEFFAEFIRCFWPTWADRLDFTGIVWLDKEVFLKPPDGPRRHLDLLAQVRVLPGESPTTEGDKELLAILHVEVESQDRVKPLRARMFEYYVQIRRSSKLPVLPIGLYLKVGLEGVGWDSYLESFWEEEILKFRYAYVGLPALRAEQYVTGEELIGVALSSLMKVTAEQRADLHAQALKRIAASRENDWRQYLLTECLEAYAEFDENERRRIEALLGTKPYQEAEPLMITTYGRGEMEGQRKLAVWFIESKFGSLSPEVTARISTLSSKQLKELARNLALAATLDDLIWPDDSRTDAGRD